MAAVLKLADNPDVRKAARAAAAEDQGHSCAVLCHGCFRFAHLPSLAHVSGELSAKTGLAYDLDESAILAKGGSSKCRLQKTILQS